MADTLNKSPNTSVAKGAGLTFLGRLGAVIELLSVVLLAQTYGAESYGIFLLFWGYIFLTSSFTNLGMVAVLQRFVPGAKDEHEAHSYLKIALTVTLTLSLIFCVITFIAAPVLSPYINAGQEKQQAITDIVRIYIWTLPLWCLVEIATGAVRARHAFGAEIRLRIFYEQFLRIVLAMVFYFLGQDTFGLYLAHLCSLFITMLLSLRLLGRFYNVSLIFRTSWQSDILGHAISYGIPMMISLATQRLYSNLPLFFLNAFLPGVRGAEAVALYGVARKIVSVLHVIRQVFSYVLSPLAAAIHAGENKENVQVIYAFSTRLICSIFIPIATFIVIFRHDILGLAGHDFVAAGSVLLILTIGRGAEALTGPANAIIDVIGRYRIPLINSFSGLSVACVLMAILVPQYEMAGAAVAAVIGLNVTSLLAFFILYLRFDLQPYDHRIVRPVLSAALFSASLFLVDILTHDLLTAWRLGIGLSTLLLILFLLYHYGFDFQDRRSLGKGPRLEKKKQTNKSSK